MPVMPIRPPLFWLKGRMTQERHNTLDWGASWLWPEEVKLFEFVFTDASEALSWEPAEKGMFCVEYFDLVKIPTVLGHKIWQERNCLIAPGHKQAVTRIILDWIEARVYELSSTSYRSNAFPVPKAGNKL